MVIGIEHEGSVEKDEKSETQIRAQIEMLFGELKLEPDSSESEKIKNGILDAEESYNNEQHTEAREKIQDKNVLDAAWELPNKDLHNKIEELIKLFFELENKIIAEFHS